MNEADILRDILDAQLDMLCRFTADGTILFANTAYARMIGHPREDLTGRNLWRFIPESEHAGVRAQLADLTPQNPTRTIENRLESSDGSVRWTLWRNHALSFDTQGRWQVAQSTGIDITERKELEDRLRLLLEELNHRVKNTLMVVQAMAWQSFRGMDAAADGVENFTARLHALAAAHTVLSRRQWAGAPMADVVQQGLTVCTGELGIGGGRRVTRSGPDLVMGAAPTVSLVLVLHELATNAIKYGALSNATGTVSVAWAVEPDGRVSLEWRERGGPPVSPPTSSGFGTRLIRDAIVRQLGGETLVDHAHDGVVARLVLPAGCFHSPGPVEILADPALSNAGLSHPGRSQSDEEPA